MTERKPYADNVCRDCSCADHNILTALAERKDAWDVANRALTDAALKWPKVGADENGDPMPPAVGSIDVLVLANWLYTGQGVGGGD
ncbi:hypothetical protein ACFWPU_00610 [Streptomyces sp. NPDC058471]|uniref:hypothetical protein n=1 Tax=Streptomyces sp. NPDC058471 TaxID=3346516 RepID=UPI003660FD52